MNETIRSLALVQAGAQTALFIPGRAHKMIINVASLCYFERCGKGSMNTVAVGPRSAVSAGVGLGLGLVMVPLMFQGLTSQARATKPVIVCLYCRGKNAEENKFCGHCGRSLYPPARVQCPKCAVKVPSLNFCENCGFKLKK